MERIRLSGEQLEKLVIDSSRELDITVNADVQASLYLYIQKQAELVCHIHIEKNATLKLLTWNESESLEFVSDIHCAAHAGMEMNCAELSDGTVTGTHKIYLEGEYSSLKLLSAASVATVKHFEIECVHDACHTLSSMENYAVMYENGDYRMVDTGTIHQGSYQSESHQTSRALVLSEKQKCEIEPVLFIDENDVQASHAMGMGQIDEAQLYYLQSRGLNKMQALGLITIGYLMPISKALDDEELMKELGSKIEKKVGLS